MFKLFKLFKRPKPDTTHTENAAIDFAIGNAILRYQDAAVVEIIRLLNDDDLWEFRPGTGDIFYRKQDNTLSLTTRGITTTVKIGFSSFNSNDPELSRKSSYMCDKCRVTFYKKVQACEDLRYAKNLELLRNL